MKAKDHARRFGQPGKCAAGTVLMALAAIILTSCPNPANNQGTGSTANLFAVDSKNGSVYEIDDGTGTAASTALVSIGQNSSGEIAFSGDVGFIAVGSYLNTAPGLYYFDASSSAPSAAMVGATKTSAQYLCIVSDTLGYVTAADSSNVYANAMYPFNPSSPASGFGTAVTGFPSGFYPQDVAYAAGRVYVAGNVNAKVYRLNAAGTAVDASYSATAGGTTGLLTGSFGGKAGIFVANSGGYDGSWNSLPGSIDFIAGDAADGAAATAVLSGYSAGRLAAFDSDTLVATTYSKTYIVELSGSGASATEVKSSADSFGSNDVDILDGYAYVPGGSNTVYRFSAAGTDVREIVVGRTGEMVSNVGVRR
jgi:hypothetical protein